LKTAFLAEISNFLETKKGFFDSIVFYGVLHHFTFSELNEVCVLMRNALKKEGIVVGYEPCYDRFDQSNATVLLILKILLNITGYYYEEIQVPNNEYELMEAIRNNLMSGKQLDEEAKEKQSVRDFSSGYTDIITSLSKNFKTVAFENDHGFFELLVGGLRGKKSRTENVADFLDIIDKKLVEIGTIQPLSFRFAGKK